MCGSYIMIPTFGNCYVTDPSCIGVSGIDCLLEDMWFLLHG
uniref:Uncharacterized protein n=1 Tax=Arundo donax TaxID=35708 RepID=A0A0A9G1G4_ARUDO